jgi:lysophospholipase L1-like esterase
VNRAPLGRISARTKTIAVRAGAVLVVIYLILALITMHPLRALGVELAGVITLWLAYAVRFAFNAPWAIAPEVFWFAIKDWMNPPPPGAVVFAGSSTMAHWTSLAEDMAPIPVVNRGINGARLNQVAYYVERLVLRHRPSAVVVYAGENDIAGFLGSRRQTPEEVLAAFQKLCDRVHSQLPKTQVFFLSIKPPKTRVAAAPELQRANSLIRAHCAADPGLHFVDVVPALSGADGLPLPSIFDVDGIHLNDEGYRILKSIVRPELMSAGLASAAARPPLPRG